MSSGDHLEICDANGKTLISRMGPGCRERCVAVASSAYEKCSGLSGEGTLRRGFKRVEQGSVFFCTRDEDMVNSKRVFSRTIDSYIEMIPGLAEVQRLAAEEVREENRRLVHNLTTLNSHIIQEIYNIVPQDDLAGTPSHQIAVIADAISGNPAAAAQAALKILKNAVASRNEMQIVRRFRTTPQLPPQLKPHMIHKVIKNVLITFFQEALERDIYLNLRATGERAWLDYELVSAALYRFFENCVKYCAPSSVVDIAFQAHLDRVEVLVEMKSLPILPGEERKIFEEGYSGETARRHSLSGSGLGMAIVRQLLEANNASILVRPGTRLELIRGIEYAPNRFILGFARARKG